MNLLHALAQTPLKWTLEKSTKPSKVDPSRSSPSIRLKVVPKPGVKTLEHQFLLGHSDMSIEHMLVVLLKRELPHLPVLCEWLDSKGNVPVKLAIDPKAFDYIGEPMHTALRKLADSDASVITWNSLHHMHGDDRAALWTGVAELVKSAFAARPTLTRRQLAQALRLRVLEVLEQRRFAELTDDKGREVKRLASEDYALRMMHTGCKLTDLDEWMWGWLGYIVEDVEEEETAEA